MIEDTEQLLRALLGVQEGGNVAKVEELRQIRASCLRVELMLSELLSEVRAWRSMPWGGDH